MDEFTTPPCQSCDAHNHLENKMEDMIKNNKTEHDHILRALDGAVTNIQWMSSIGKWILVTILGYFIVLGIYIINGTATENKRIDEIHEKVAEGEILHYRNENTIATIKAAVEYIKEKVDGK